MVSSKDKPLYLTLLALLAVMNMLAGVLITQTTTDPLTSAFGILLATQASLALTIALVLVALELDTSTTQTRRPSQATRQLWTQCFKNLIRRPSPPDSLPLTDLERGPAHPWNLNRTPTIARAYPAPRLLVTPTGLPSDWDRPDNTAPIAAALASMRPRPGPVRVAPLGRGTATRGTQTAMRNVRGPRAEERMPGGMAPMTFWWLLLEDQRLKELARSERENRRWSY